MNDARKLAAAGRMLADLSAIIAELQVSAEQEKSASLEWVSPAVAAERFGVPAGSIRSLCQRKRFGRKVGGRWETDLSALRNYFGKRDNRDETVRVSRSTTGT
ncbi:hypothetical protein [Mesorhizobium sophorae]|uniref:hypothetical protein n=1 Tax=Mesorhizobium sophorae TaxID=1300294 RepID=UPI000BA3D998|nr:hypothetical protein [Mesorhizobium sophorae]